MFRGCISLLRNVRLESTLARQIAAKPIGLAPRPAAMPAKNNSEDQSLPINVEAVYHAPLRNSIKYGDLVAELQLRSYDNENLDFYCDFILRVGYYLGMPLTGPKPLPTRRERWTVIKSPFAQAKSKENFERHTHKRLIKVWDTTPEVVNIWLAYINKHCISGVGMKCNVFTKVGMDQEYEPTNVLEKLNKLAKENEGNAKSMDEVVGEKVLEILDTPEFKKHL